MLGTVRRRVGEVVRRWSTHPYEGVGSAVKASVSAVLAWVLAGWLVSDGSDFYAPLVAVLTVQTTVASTLRDGVQRLAGVALGLALGYAELRVVGAVTWWSLGLTLFLATLLSRWHRLGAQGAQIPIAALLMLLFARNPTDYAETLLAEGVLGALVASLVNLLLVPPLYVQTAQEAVARLRSEIGDALDRMSSDVGADPWPPEHPRWARDARALTAVLGRAREAVDRGSESVHLNFRARRLRQRPRRHGNALLALEHVVVSVRELARILATTASGPEPEERLPAPFRRELTELLRTLASAVSSYGRPAGGPEVAAEQVPLEQAHDHLMRLQFAVTDEESAATPSLLPAGALLAEVDQVVHDLRQAELHGPALGAAPERRRVSG